ncbi:MAG: UxaA family hydrolase [Kosmotogaceae bacterium]|nr:UxaA family hydrolase [Kosmotogaceae bacterium]
MKQAILLSVNDNVATVLERVGEGEEIQVKGVSQVETIVAKDEIPSGHKVAVRDIRKRERIIKYDNKIGVATADISTGQHVHVQNVVSERTEINEGGERA